MILGPSKEDILQHLMENHPDYEKDIAYHFTQNIEYIRQSVLNVLDRELDSLENERLRQHSLDLSIHQVAQMYNQELEDEKTKEENG